MFYKRVCVVYRLLKNMCCISMLYFCVIFFVLYFVFYILFYTFVFYFRVIFYVCENVVLYFLCCIFFV